MKLLTNDQIIRFKINKIIRPKILNPKKTKLGFGPEKSANSMNRTAWEKPILYKQIIIKKNCCVDGSKSQ